MSEQGIHLVGNAHLDPAWMWRMSEGLEAFSATCRSALDRLDEFPAHDRSSTGFIFTASSAAHYAFVEETDPELFSRIQQAVRDGRWSIVGGWWVEADCNLPSGESFIRQALLGQRYFESRFGRIATVGYNIDSFGHNANLPQLLRKAGLTSYVFMRPRQEEKKLPTALFAWEAPSGDRVTTYRLPLHYSNWEFSIREKTERLESFELYDSTKPWMLFFGVGNHGGGPTIAELQCIEAMIAEGRDVEYSDPGRFFASADTTKIPVLRDEMQPHAIGCYSAHSEIKCLNRLAERMLHQAETAEVLAYIIPLLKKEGVGGGPDLNRAWQNVCFNQFHDLLGGVAISEACDDAISMFREAISIAERSARLSLQRIASNIDTSKHIENLIIFNLAAHEREELVEFELWHPEASEKGKPIAAVFLVSNDGTKIATQQIESSGKIGQDRVRFVAKVTVPPLGWSTFGIERIIDGAFDEPAIILGNNDLPLFYHAQPIIIRDDSDTWAHGETSFRNFEEPFHLDSTEVIEHGPIRKGIRIRSSASASRMEEEILTEEGSNGIEIRYYLEWREKHKILKLRFQHACKNPVARYEIPYAWIERPIGAAEWPGQSWVNVAEADGSRGLAIATDSKYSYSVDEEYIYVIAARSPLVAHHVPPHEMKSGERERYLDQGEQEFRVLVIPYEREWSGNVLSRLQNPLIAHTESSHRGELARSFAGIERKSCAIHIGAMKMAEDLDGIILRAVEQAGETSEAEFALPTISAKWKASFHPFEIKSFLIQQERVTEVDFLERPL